MREHRSNTAPWLAGVVLLVSLLAPAASQSAPDADMDGVADASDHCPYTPAGARVDAYGCSSNTDRDGDGIPDEVDDCPSSPRGAQVDAKGCAVDDDRDGVANGPDLCPRSAPGLKVDARGCAAGQVAGKSTISASPANVSSAAAPGAAALPSFDFAALSTALDAEGQSRFKAALPKLRQALSSNPGQVLEIRGYADAASDGARAQVLATARAVKLREMLEAKGFDRSRLRSVGQWPSPVSARRVELVLAK